MKVIVEVANKQLDPALLVAQNFDNGKQLENCDYYLRFETANLILSNLTASRLNLLDALRSLGACSIYALAKHVKRNYSNVHHDVKELQKLGLLKNNAQNQIYVPFDKLEIHFEFQKIANG